MRKTRRKRLTQEIIMVYWQGEQYWLGKLLGHPEIMSQGATVKELEANLRDACAAMKATAPLVPPCGGTVSAAATPPMGEAAGQMVNGKWSMVNSQRWSSP